MMTSLDLPSPQPTDTPTERSWIRELNLYYTERDLINEQNELNDRCMDAASTLLRQKFPDAKGLQATVVIQSPEHCQSMGQDQDSVQIVHSNVRHHWIASAMREGQLYLYDSLQSTKKLDRDSTTSLKTSMASWMTT